MIRTAFAVVDARLRVAAVSSRFGELLGIGDDAVPGAMIGDVLPPAVAALIEERVRVVSDDGSRHVEIEIAGPDGLTQRSHVAVAPMHHTDDHRGAIAVATDVTQQRRDEDRLRLQSQLLESVGQPLVATDPDGWVTYWNAAAERTYGWAAEEILGKRVFDVMTTQQTREQAEQIQRATARGQPWSGEFMVRRRDGTMIPVAISNNPILDDAGEPIGAIGASIDISDLVQAERRASVRATQHAAVAAVGELAVAEAELDAVLMESCARARDALQADFVSLRRLERGDMLRLVAGDGIDPAFIGTHTVPISEDSLAGYTLTADGPVRVDDLVTDERFELPTQLTERGAVSAVTSVLRARGRPIGVFSAYRSDDRPFEQDDVNVLRSIGNVVAHVIERSESQTALARLALTDGLTGLPNRTTLLDRLQHALNRRGTTHLALLYADLDDFKDINDAMGHDAGDQVLRIVAERLQDAVRDGDTVARLGGDEFAVVCEHLPDPEDATAAGDRLIAAVNSRPIALGDREVRIDMSVGIVIADEAATPAALLQDADTAMYVAKAAGGSRVRRFDAEMRDAIVHRLNLVGQLREAVPRSELEVHFQPEIVLGSDQVWAEALVRWRHPERGLLPPSAFIGIAEETGITVDLGRWVLEQAAAQLATWNAGGDHLPVSVSVNLAASQLVESDFVATTAAVLDHTGIDPATLWFELTETALLREPERSIAALEGLKELGVGLAIDDFGTGYSSLAYARSLPIDAVKIDRSFVSGMGEHLKDDGIVRAVIGLADSFGILSIAEGVETPRQLEDLRAMGCSLAQGYLFMKPGPPEEIEAWCRGRSSGQ